MSIKRLANELSHWGWGIRWSPRKIKLSKSYEYHRKNIWTKSNDERSFPVNFKRISIATMHKNVLACTNYSNRTVCWTRALSVIVENTKIRYVCNG